VRYCHWKSNAFLDRTRQAENDLDLLIWRTDADRFSTILHRLGFKQAWSPSSALPGVLSFYGYDADADRLVHVHAHYQLIVGDDLTKNYRVPLEHALLDAAVHDGEFLVPPVELEYMLLVIRLALKHTSWDAFLARRGGVPASAREELAFLQARVEPGLLDDRLAQCIPFLDPESFAACARAVAPGCGAWVGMRATRRLMVALKPWARRPRAADVRLKLWRRGAGILRRHLLSRPAPRKQLATGGAMIAIVGADGAGKSTAVEGLYEWLAKSFDVTRTHLGRPPRSRTTKVIRNLLRARRALPTLRGRMTAPGRPAAPAQAGERAILAVALARDRARAFRSVRRTATNGGIVLCDRFPIPQLTLMDAPRIRRMGRVSTWTRLVSRLSPLEVHYYRAMRPDVLIVLRVDPEIAVARKPEEAAEFVRARWREIWDVDWTKVSAHVVDASRPSEEVLALLKSLVWSEI
jgi:thymidylate kinase